MKEIDRRIKRGVRNIQISPLFEKGKIYNLKTYEEDMNGTLAPEWNHCWLTWEAMWRDENGVDHWGQEAYSFKTLEEAQEARTYLEKHVVKVI